MPIWLQVVVGILAVPVGVAGIVLALFVGLWVTAVLVSPLAALHERSWRPLVEPWELVFAMGADLLVWVGKKIGVTRSD